MDELEPEYLEKPYFVIPEDDVQAEAFAVVRKALQKTKKAALGKIAFGGREHVIAITAPDDDKLAGMMAYTMRYQEELRNPAEYFRDIKKIAVNEDSLELAETLIKKKSAKFDPAKFIDGYEVALKELVEAKVKHAPIPKDETSTPKRGNVINLMDALRKSVGGGEGLAARKKPVAKADHKKGLSLVKPSAKSANTGSRKRKSA
jgi:DNA end-binding protein Ku